MLSPCATKGEIALPLALSGFADAKLQALHRHDLREPLHPALFGVLVRRGEEGALKLPMSFDSHQSVLEPHASCIEGFNASHVAYASHHDVRSRGLPQGSFGVPTARNVAPVQNARHVPFGSKGRRASRCGTPALPTALVLERTTLVLLFPFIPTLRAPLPLPILRWYALSLLALSLVRFEIMALTTRRRMSWSSPRSCAGS
jgi:hypothetical protein